MLWVVTGGKAAGGHQEEPPVGIFKQFKDMANVVAAAPEMIDQARQMQANAQSYNAAAQQAAGIGYASGSTIAQDDPRLAPIAGVDLPTYVRVVKAATVAGLGADGLVARAEAMGVPAEAWQQAATGWPARMRGDTALAVHYGTLYAQVGV